jgi:hypothetical protein
MEEGLPVPSLFDIATKRILETASVDDCDEILQHATKRRQHFNDVELREMLRALPPLAAFGALIDTVSIVVTPGSESTILFVLANVQYHYIWMGYSYVVQCNPACALNGHTSTKDTHVSRTSTSIGKAQRPSDPSDWSTFILWIEALDVQCVEDVVKAYTRTLKLKRI